MKAVPFSSAAARWWRFDRAWLQEPPSFDLDTDTLMQKNTKKQQQHGKQLHLVGLEELCWGVGGGDHTELLHWIKKQTKKQSVLLFVSQSIVVSLQPWRAVLTSTWHRHPSYLKTTIWSQQPNQHPNTQVTQTGYGLSKTYLSHTPAGMKEQRKEGRKEGDKCGANGGRNKGHSRRCSTRVSMHSWACTWAHERSQQDKPSHILWSLYSSITVGEKKHTRAPWGQHTDDRRAAVPAHGIRQTNRQPATHAGACTPLRVCALTEPVIQPANNPCLQDVLLFSANPSRQTETGFRAAACGLKRRQRNTDQ